ncbi:MAG: hypothetical protein MUF13_08675, partial [Akkermansiaceae bacterium]|nr:hypothetical protein [Akkermansiaceae bacterium]
SLVAGNEFSVKVESLDPDGDPLSFRWAVLPEATQHNGHKQFPMPKAVEHVLHAPSGPEVQVKAPAKPGVYRLHVWVKDGKGHAATANMPFEVK